VTESPKTLKQQAKTLLKFLQKHNVVLDLNGDPDYSKVKNKNIINVLKKKESLVKVTLML
jgi:hypothetical protein